MSNAVIARQQGDDYQAKFFWYKACKIFWQNSTAVKVAWEKNDSPGFDDVSIHYMPGRLDKTTGNEIYNEYFQVKFHVDHDRGFSFTALTDPLFIGNQTESVLQRMVKNYKANPEEFVRSLYYLHNTWGIDHTDAIKHLIDNNGAIRLEKLFDGSGGRSKMGKIRECWKKHLEVDDNTLRLILAQLRITHGAPGLDRLTEDLNFRLNSVGLQPMDEAMRSTRYTSLIQQLHAEKRNVFTKEELLEILTRENLFAENNQPESVVHKVGVRSFKKGTDNMPFETDEHLCLLHHFMGRFPVDDDLWKAKIFPELLEFSDAVIAKNKPLEIQLDTHHSIAFALGNIFNSKSGISVGVVQKTRAGKILFAADHTADEYKLHEGDSNWHFSETNLTDNGTEIALAISVTHNIGSDVLDFVKGGLPNVGKVVEAIISCGTSPVSIRDGNHILLAIIELIRKVRDNRSAQEKKCILHLFVAAPNAFLFSLGQHISALGKIVLYEYDFEQFKTGSYSPSISLPI